MICASRCGDGTVVRSVDFSSHQQRYLQAIAGNRKRQHWCCRAFPVTRGEIGTSTRLVGLVNSRRSKTRYRLSAAKSWVRWEGGGGGRPFARQSWRQCCEYCIEQFWVAPPGGARQGGRPGWRPPRSSPRIPPRRSAAPTARTTSLPSRISLSRVPAAARGENPALPGVRDRGIHPDGGPQGPVSLRESR